MNKKRIIKDILFKISTYFSSLISIIILFGIILYVLINGAPSLSWKFLTSNYNETMNIITVFQNGNEFKNPNIKNAYFSNKYGIAICDDKTVDGKDCLKVVYVDKNSPFNNAKSTSTNEIYKIKVGETVDVLIGVSKDNKDVYASTKDKAEKFVIKLDSADEISYLQCVTLGGGIKGSLITTMYLIILSLLFSLPLGIGAAIYLVLYAKNGKFKNIISNMIDATSGIPSIIFGFVGMIVFIPFVSTFSSKNTYSILAGALTMTIILLPTIIKTTSESLKSIPSYYMSSSLALGASKTQTIFKVILPSSLPGILSATLLSIGRIIGESAALIFVMGTSIEDNINIFSGSTSLSLHIWSITREEVPNFNVACAISIIILLVVFIMNILVKIISYYFYKKKGGI